MEIVKVGLVIAAGLGSTWAARQATDALFGGRQSQYEGQSQSQYQSLAQTAEPPASSGSDARDPSAKPAPPAVPEMSRQEMDDELKRAQAEIAGGGKEAELREFRPTKPLPADLPIALPSDI